MHFRLLILTAALLVAVVAEVGACQVCLPYPTRSLADDLIEAEHVVLCREDPANPFTLKITKVLKGGEPDTPLDLFLDSSSRRMLASNPGRSIVCVSSIGHGDPPWKRVATLTPELAPVLEHILGHSEQWAGQPEKRAAYFSRFLNHDHGPLSTLAHLEVARAPYDTIKQLAATIPRERIHRFLANFRMLEWHAPYILFLAQSEDPADHERIRKAAKNHAKYTLNMQTSAWATAYIEVAREEALDFYDKHYLTNPSRSEEERAAILAAYSVHGTNGHTDLRPRILQSYTALASIQPSSITAMIPDLIQWKEDGLRLQAAKLLTDQSTPLNIEQTLQIRRYLRSFQKPK